MDGYDDSVHNEVHGDVVGGTVIQAHTITLPPPSRSAQDDAAEKLAGLVGDQWREESRLRDLDGVRGIPVRWRSIDGTVAGGAAALADAFRARVDHRMVIVGGAGTGKTSFAVALVREFVSRWSVDDPVPVLVSAAGWSVEEHPDVRGWFVEQLERTYSRGTGLSADVLAGLVADGRVLMILDGVDEIPAEARAVAVQALNDRFTLGDRLVLTCRTEEYGRSVLLGDVLVVEPEPVSPSVAADYLERVLPGWGGAAAVRAGVAGGVGEVVTTAFGLWLVGLAGEDDLLGLPHADAVRARLLDRLVPVLVARRRPDRRSSRWARFRRKHRIEAPSVTRRAHDPVDVERTLGLLALHLGEGPFAWWELGDDVREARGSRWVLVVFAAVSGLVGLGCFVADALTARTLGPAFIAGAVGGVFGALFGFVTGRSSLRWAGEPPAFADFRFRGRFRATLEIAVLLVVICVVETVAGAVFDQSTSTLLGWYAMAVLFGVARWMETPSPEGAPLTPSDSWRADRRVNLIRWALGLTAVPIVFGLRINLGFVPGFETALLHTGPFFWVAAWFWTTAVVVMTTGEHRAWMGYLLATTRLAATGDLPRDLMPFLDDAHRMGLLRAVGPVYEFRHEYVRTYLAGKFVEQR